MMGSCSRDFVFHSAAFVVMIVIIIIIITITIVTTTMMMMITRCFDFLKLIKCVTLFKYLDRCGESEFKTGVKLCPKEPKFINTSETGNCKGPHTKTAANVGYTRDLITQKNV